MKKSVTISKVSGLYEAPPSKSAAIRAIAIAAQKQEPTRISGLCGCEDIEAALQMASALGVRIQKYDTHHQISGGLQDQEAELSSGESALAFRVFAPIAARLSSKIRIQATASLLSRPQQFLVDSLASLGVQCTASNGFPPLELKGPITQNTCTIDGSHGSQLVSGLLIAMAQNPGGFCLNLINPTSKPYIDLTLETLQSFGIEVQRQGYDRFYIPADQRISGAEFEVEGDFSSAAFFAVLAATKGEISLANLRQDSLQADAAIITALRSAGAICEWQGDTLLVKKQELLPFSFDATNCPDLFPPLVALAAHIDGICVIKGTHRLYHKESNRAQSLVEAFGRLGVALRETEDKLIIRGATLRSGTINPMGDHRIAMAAAICADQKISIGILNTYLVNKSYKNFFSDLAQAGGTIE